MPKLRVLVLAPECNPESVTTPQIAHAHAVALAQHHAVTLVVRAANEAPIRRAGASFEAIHPVRLPGLDGFYRWALRRVFKFDYGRQSLTAATYPLQIAFEWRAWWQLRNRILRGDFDVVLRILPIITVLPSPFAYFLRKGPIPFVLGPLNGGLPWPEGFPQLDTQRNQAGYGVFRLRDCYRYMPFARSTYRDAAAIIAGSSHTYSEFTSYRNKLFFVPGENGLEPAVLDHGEAIRRYRERKVRFMFVGRLIPLKACDLALRAAAHLLQSGAAEFTVVGDGVERKNLQALVSSLGIEKMVTFTGWVSRDEVLAQLGRADVFVFPSLREFGGAVVFEALALGAVPVVADFGGPGDIVTAEVGYRIPLINEADFVQKLSAVLDRLAVDREHLETLRQQGMAYARERLTWDGKARSVSKVLQWVTGNGPKPDLPPPSHSSLAIAS
jgi:glycosyltransferase involved in cell wall biosynthesis